MLLRHVVFLALTPIFPAALHGGDDEKGPTLEVQPPGTTDGTGVNPSVFVYADPAFDNSDLIECYRQHHVGLSPWQDERGDMAQDMAEVWMHRTLLEHPWRVLDATRADLFYVPIYPILSFKLLGKKEQCNGRTHTERIHGAIDFLVRNSPFFNRYGGADHMVVCTWWNCRVALDEIVRMRLARTVLGINERIQGWSRWGCNQRMVTLPYVASSAVTTPALIGGRPPEERSIPFFFVGTSRKRPERENLAVARDLYPGSIIEIGERGKFWSENATVYAGHMTRSRYCFCPRGDTATSRRIFDAVAAGCIPVLTEGEALALPFLDNGLHYEEFSSVLPRGTFGTEEKVKELVQELHARSDEDLEPMRRALHRMTPSVIYGISSGPDISDMQPYRSVADNYVLSAWRTFVGGDASGQISDGNIWSCSTPPYEENILAPRTFTEFPVPEESREQWLYESETIVIEEKKLLFCTPPNTGSMQFRMLAKRIQGLDDWAVHDDRAKLFSPQESGLALLDTSNGELLERIYAANGSGWIKIAVVRDPVTRLLSAYLDLQRARNIRPKYSTIKNDGHNDNDNNQDEDNDITADTATYTGAWGAPGSIFDTSDEGGALLPFGEFVDRLTVAEEMGKAGAAFRPWSNLCGIRHAPFESIIPFESLKERATEVVKSLPGAVWDTYASDGWGPQLHGEFMEFDYGGANSWLFPSESEVQTTLPITRTEDLFDGSSCEWTKFYTEESILDKVFEVYASDYDMFTWYGINKWKERLQDCLVR